ncbi:hypothetical protein V8F06_001064 [Rhypophila decipiens]
MAGMSSARTVPSTDGRTEDASRHEQHQHRTNLRPIFQAGGVEHCIPRRRFKEIRASHLILGPAMPMTFGAICQSGGLFYDRKGNDRECTWSHSCGRRTSSSRRLRAMVNYRLAAAVELLGSCRRQRQWRRLRTSQGQQGEQAYQAPPVTGAGLAPNSWDSQVLAPVLYPWNLAQTLLVSGDWIWRTSPCCREYPGNECLTIKINFTVLYGMASLLWSLSTHASALHWVNAQKCEFDVKQK